MHLTKKKNKNNKISLQTQQDHNTDPHYCENLLFYTQNILTLQKNVPVKIKYFYCRRPETNMIGNVHIT
jgi:hypothetical protein